MTPRNAEVYVDGYLVGTVDDFDGFFQRLDVPVGGHELTVYLEGYRTFTEKVYFRPGATLAIEHDLEPLGPGESPGARPAPAADASRRPYEGRPERTDDPRRTAAYGALAIRVQPLDAVILVDGDEWSAPAGSGPLVIDLPAGPHDVEIRSDGFATFRRTVMVRPGETVPVNVRLSR